MALYWHQAFKASIGRSITKGDEKYEYAKLKTQADQCQYAKCALADTIASIEEFSGRHGGVEFDLSQACVHITCRIWVNRGQQLFYFFLHLAFNCDSESPLSSVGLINLLRFSKAINCEHLSPIFTEQFHTPSRNISVCHCPLSSVLTAPLYPLGKIRPFLIRILSSFFLILVVMETGQLFQINIWFEDKLGLIRLNVSLSALCAHLRLAGVLKQPFVFMELYSAATETFLN